MKRAALAWTIFWSALAVGLGVMLFFTGKMLDLERSVAQAQARAALEETVRLALWRMDSAAALLLNQKVNPSLILGNGNSDIDISGNVAQRTDPSFQQALSGNELQSRKQMQVAAPADWHTIAPVLLDRVSDILPGAKLEEAGVSRPGDTRLLATIPARLVVPASALPDSSLPWNTPVRISLLIAWGCALLTAGALARLLGATLSLSSRRGAFASAVTHEMRTPLTTFRMYAEMLATGMVEDETARRHYLETLVAESDRLGRLIENVLSYSRLENRLAPRREMAQISAVELVDQALPALRRRVAQAGLALRVSHTDAPAACRTDAVAVGQILINLVDNACKYGQTEIELTTRLVGGRLEISVADRGPGIDPQRKGGLFSAFSKSKTDAMPGIGLGLFVSRQLARGLGGDLEYRASERGALFVLRLETCR